MTRTRVCNSAQGCAPFQQLCRFFAISFLGLVGSAFFSASFCVDAYRVGDTVDAVVTTRSALTIDLLMANQPLFGVTKTVHLPRLPERFSMSFDEGLHTLPYIDAAITERLVVTFVYSKSGNGRIHSVTSKAIVMSMKSATQRKFDPKREVEVLFDWVEEADVDFEAGMIVAFLVVFVVSILFLMQLLSIDHPDDDGDEGFDRGGSGSGGRNNSYYKGR